ncbi:hypothetical protein [Rivularia sp. UHCC 0363]|uniref:hypothetical protein n=1 Tax=Rivularia sp. UHCC 0363 TaxID=3110244 RepID=UPI002B217DAE|nr:hypothetical protein [Rivularia sp. UHCC 0363]MEA5597518.1 hypothetical protein [Rivularia sp. UHCC 0363]
MQSDEYAENSCSVGKNLEKLYYEKVFNEIYPQIKHQKKGILSTVIHILLDPEESQAQKICNRLEIKDNALLKDDLSISSDILRLFISNSNQSKRRENNIFLSVKERVKNVGKSLPNDYKENDMNLFQFVAIGCFLVGVFAFIKNFETKKTESEVEKDDKTDPPNQNNFPPKPKIPKPAVLCLVVSASVVKNLKINNPINVSQIEELIDNASYFLCTSPKDADTIQPHLELTDEDILNASDNTEVYVRIDIDYGEEIIGQTVPYILKKNLPRNEKLVVSKLACLKYLSVSGLEKFNRI